MHLLLIHYNIAMHKCTYISQITLGLDLNLRYLLITKMKLLVWENLANLCIFQQYGVPKLEDQCPSASKALSDIGAVFCRKDTLTMTSLMLHSWQRGSITDGPGFGTSGSQLAGRSNSVGGTHATHLYLRMYQNNCSIVNSQSIHQYTLYLDLNTYRCMVTGSYLK